MEKLNASLNHTFSHFHTYFTSQIAYLEQELGMPAIGLMAKLKSAIDPDGIMNPGKVLRHKRDSDGRLVVNICT